MLHADWLLTLQKVRLHSIKESAASTSSTRSLVDIDDQLKLKNLYFQKMNFLQTNMIPFRPNRLNPSNPPNSTKTRTREIFHTKTLQNFTQLPFIVSTFNQISCSSLNPFSSNTALRHFKRKTMAEMNPQFTIDEYQGMETQPIYLSSDESEIASFCSSPIQQLPNNFLIRTVPYPN